MHNMGKGGTTVLEVKIERPEPCPSASHIVLHNPGLRSAVPILFSNPFIQMRKDPQRPLCIHFSVDKNLT